MVGQHPILVPLPTPFTDDGTQASEVRFARAMRWHMDRGANGFLVGSEAGEWWSLSLAERKTAVEWAVREARGLPVYVHCTAWTTAASLDLAQSAQRHGANGVIFTVPPYPALSEKETESFGAILNRYIEIPIAYYTELGIIGSLKLIPLEADGLSALCLSKNLDVCESKIEGALVHPAAVFSANRFRKLSNSWIRWKMRLGPLFKTHGLARIGKAVIRLSDLDLGSPRPPMGDLPPEALSVLAEILKEVDSEA